MSFVGVIAEEDETVMLQTQNVFRGQRNHPEEKCPRKEVFRECGGCGYSCAPQACASSCTPQCECKKGWLRRSDDKCVRRNNRKCKKEMNQDIHAMQECSSSSTVVPRHNVVDLPEVFVRPWVATSGKYPGVMAINGFDVQQGGLVNLSVTLEMDGAWAALGFPNAEPWCQEKGTHAANIYIRGWCRASDLDDGDFEYYKFHLEHQLSMDCQGQRLGTCRILRVNKHQWIESQDAPENGGGTGAGGSMEETGDGELLLKWGVCPDQFKSDFVIAHSLADVDEPEDINEPQPECTDGEVDKTDPCAPAHCIGGRISVVAIDCEVHFGGKCAGQWVPVEGECCPTCEENQWLPVEGEVW